MSEIAPAVRVAPDPAHRPIVSVVVIAYNEEATIGACLASILAQEGLADFELIVVDDASTDGTGALVESLQREHAPLRLIRHPRNRGRGAARRTGQDACAADTVAFVDSDIVLPPDWLARTVSSLEHADAVSGVAVPDGDCAVVWRIFRPQAKGTPGNWSLTGNNVVFRRSALDTVGWPPTVRCGEDSRLSVAMADAGLTVMTLPDLKVEHREAKSYVQAVRYMVETGTNATELLRDLRRFRLPDLAWVAWDGGIVVAVATGAAGVLTWWQAAAIVVVATVAIDVGAMRQRFSFRATPLRWLAAAAAYLPMIGAYLVARTVSAPRLLGRRRPVLG